MNEDLGLDWLDYGARYYDPAIGRFTGVDPISDQFPHVTTYNYAENEPIGHIDLWGLQKYKPKMEQLNGPSDLFSRKMLNNLKEGLKTVAIEAGSYIDAGGNALGKWMSNNLPGPGTPDPGDYTDPDVIRDGSGVEILAEPGSANGTLGTPGAEEGSTVILGPDDMLLPADAGGAVGDAAGASTQASRLTYYGALAIDKASNISSEGDGSDSDSREPVDSLCNTCNRPPHGNFNYRRLDPSGNPIDTIRPKEERNENNQ